MNILYFLIGCSILMALIFLYAFFWAVKDGQNDDMQTPAMRILFDEDPPDDTASPPKKSDQDHTFHRQRSLQYDDNKPNFTPGNQPFTNN